MAEQHEIVLRHPAQEGDGLLGIGPARRGHLGLRRAQQAEHGREGGGCRPHIGQGASQCRLQRAQRLGRGRRRPRQHRPGGAEGDAHHALASAARGVEGQQMPRRIPANAQHRMQQRGHRPAMQRQGGERRIDQEGHVVGDDLGDRARADARPGRQQPNLGGPRRAVRREAVEAGGGEPRASRAAWRRVRRSAPPQAAPAAARPRRAAGRAPGRPAHRRRRAEPPPAWCREGRECRPPWRFLQLFIGPRGTLRQGSPRRPARR